MRVLLSAASLCLALAAGVTAQAWIERDAWPIDRSGAALAFDAKRERVVLFGGSRGSDRLSDTWHWDGHGWSRLTRPRLQEPPGREHHAMAYDPARGTVFLFGGETALTALGDHWEWVPSGSYWQPLPPAIVWPPARSRHALAADLARGRVVLFGGLDDGVVRHDLADTWEWDGTTWSPLAPAVSPPARRGHGMAYDPLRARVVLFGGSDRTGVFADTWEWDGNVWQQRNPTASPRGGSGVMAFDAQSRRAVWFSAGQTWAWDGVTWTRQQSATTPVGDHLVGDARGRVLLFGGSSQAATTWEWDGVDWAPRLPPAQPRPGAAAADTGRQRVVLLSDSETWEWDGARWSRRNPATTPTARGLLAYDGRRQRTVLFGVANPGNQPQTWEWDGANWQRQTPAATPSSRVGFALAYDELRARTVLFGGRSSGGVRLGDTWEWDGVNWLLRSSPSGPAPRFGHAMAYDAHFGRRIVLYGGQGIGSLLMDTWAWDGHWTLVYPNNTPRWRWGHVMAPGPSWSSVFLYGGFDSTSAPLNDAYSWFDPQWAREDAPTEIVNRPALSNDPARDGMLLHGANPYGRSTTWTFGISSLVKAYGTSCASSSVKPTLTTFGQARLGNDRFALDVDGVRANAPVALLLSTAKASLMFGGCPLLVDPTTLWMIAGTSNAFGAESFVLPIPVDRRITGRIYAQAVGLDPTLSQFALTHGLEIGVGS